MLDVELVPKLTQTSFEDREDGVLVPREGSYDSSTDADPVTKTSAG